MKTPLAPSTPAEALEALQNARDPLIDDHVRLFQSMPLRDRIEFLFRSVVNLSVQQAHIINALSRIPGHVPASDAGKAVPGSVPVDSQKD